MFCFHVFIGVHYLAYQPYLRTFLPTDHLYTPTQFRQALTNCILMFPLPHGLQSDLKIMFVCLCWGLTSQSTIFQSCRDGATASWVINQYFRGVKCLAQGHNTAAVGFEPPTSRSGVRHSTTEPPRSPLKIIFMNHFSLISQLSQIKN